MLWKWETAVYLWLAGLGGGAYFAAFLADRLSGGKYKEWVRFSVYLGVPVVLLGSLLLVMDLGQQLRSWHLFTGFRLVSPMSMGSWILLIWSAIGVAMIALWFAEAFPAEEKGPFSAIASALRPLVPVVDVLSWVAFVLAALLIAYTGVLLSATNQALWGGALLLPALFVASAISTGIAALLVVTSTRIGPFLRDLFGEVGETTTAEAVEELGKADAVVMVIEAVVLTGYLFWLSAFSTPDAAWAAGLLLSGSLSPFFWIGVVFTGLLIPLGSEFIALRKAESGVPVTALVSALSALFGGLVLRAVVVFGGQIGA
jgi:formate-dependent nitrite reductase membrane component NrfD